MKTCFDKRFILKAAAGLLFSTLLLSACGQNQAPETEFPSQAETAEKTEAQPAAAKDNGQAAAQPAAPETVLHTEPHLTVNSDGSVNLWENAREESLMIGWWENGEGAGNHLFHDKAREVVDRLRQFTAWPADSWTVDLVAGPVYSVFSLNSEGGPLAGAWSNGYFIMQDGKVYRCDADLSFIRDLLADPSLNPDIAISNMITNRRYLSQKDGEWIRERLYPANELSASSGSISASLAKPYEDGRVTVLLKNNSPEDVLYGEGFSLQVCLDGSWYSVPSMPDANYSFTDIGYGLSSGQSTEKEYSLNRMFINPELPAGELPAGTYRLVFREGADKNYSVEFEVPKTVRIWEKASQTSMITAGLYENGTVRTAGLYDAEKQTVLEKLCRISAAPAEDWTSDLVTEPIYTLLAWDYATGKPVSGLWSNGYFIMQDGKVYRCSEDLSFLRDLISDPSAGEGIQPDYYLSNWRYISQKDGRWIKDRLIPAPETAAPPEGIVAEIDRDYADGQLAVRFKNQRDSEWSFGYGYSLQVRLDGNWYLVPQMSDREYTFPAVALLLPAGGLSKQTYSMKTMYLNPDLPSGDLPAGSYRIQIGDVQPLFVEFEIP